jgi:hypothetical protein
MAPGMAHGYQQHHHMEWTPQSHVPITPAAIHSASFIHSPTPYIHPSRPSIRVSSIQSKSRAATGDRAARRGRAVFARAHGFVAPLLVVAVAAGHRAPPQQQSALGLRRRTCGHVVIGGDEVGFARGNMVALPRGNER